MSNSLMDAYGRTIQYLRVSITDLCNLRCIYCRPPEGVPLVTHEEILRYEEILAIVGIFRDLGIKKIRVTGGEPLVRRGVREFIARLAAMKGIEDVGLTTNGVLLASMAKDLRAAGLKRVNVSLDSMDRENFRRITGSDKLELVLKGIREALAVGFSPVKINVVLLQGINETDVAEFARLTIHEPVYVRFIERMPFGSESLPSSPDSFSAHRVLEMIRKEVGELKIMDREPLDGPATMYTLKGAAGRIGIIDPVTGHFCGTCNRMRLTARGTLRPCLLGSAEIDVKTPLRHGATPAELTEIVRSAVLAKPVGHPGEPQRMCDGMNTIGG
ncbi:GTP 3',8-cyclase MoaA [Desulfomonile tiedjei]|uniref:GTP 3',8-cyclase n=1 Tax=Desulfomonile tiedjei (strain ATCC 49306 / DSM 6799 / DCB-1) TaxID=706587 RepID=I4C3W1_DESTA|nr:GTP 3',8-cyclase MoaA [Desulfomonile tiedjei]AFM24252.1 molybdenum cofactor biosynthesis protein A [Desulfomonile tiedjei DSM 6799]